MVLVVLLSDHALASQVTQPGCFLVVSLAMTVASAVRTSEYLMQMMIFAVTVVNDPRAIIVALRHGHFLALQVSLRERGSLLRSATAIATRAFIITNAASSKQMTNLTIVVVEKGDE